MQYGPKPLNVGTAKVVTTAVAVKFKIELQEPSEIFDSTIVASTEAEGTITSADPPVKKVVSFPCPIV